MREGSVPANNSRITRRDRTKVLPEPALALTQAELAGWEALDCASKVEGGIGGAISSPPHFAWTIP